MVPNSNRKGSSFERDIAHKLSLWASNKKDKWIFCRRSGSGGALRDKQGHTDSGGDIYADKVIGKWLTDRLTFELKFYYNLKPDLWKFVCGKKSRIDDFILQAKESADVYNRDWCLIMKCNGMDIILITSLVGLSTVIYGGSIMRAPVASFIIPLNDFLMANKKVVCDYLKGGK